MDPDFFITVLHVSDGPHFSKSGTAMVVPVVAGATPLLDLRTPGCEMVPGANVSGQCLLQSRVSDPVVGYLDPFVGYLDPFVGYLDPFGKKNTGSPVTRLEIQLYMYIGES